MTKGTIMRVPKRTESIVPVKEAIAFQNDESVLINDLLAHFSDLCEELDMIKTKRQITNEQFMTMRPTKETLLEIDTILLKRFGINFKHIAGTGMGYAVTPIQPKGVNVLAGDINKKIESLQEFSRDAKYKDKHDIDSFKGNVKTVFKNVLASHRELSTALATRNVQIDLKMAKIRNLPSAFHCYVLLDIVDLREHNLSPLEMIATLLHEVGHAFTHISESYRTTNIIESLTEAMTEFDDHDNHKNYKLMNERIFGGEQVLNEDDGLETVILKSQKKILNIKLNPNSGEEFVESERMADQFATRFGLGKPLVSALHKLHRGMEESRDNSTTASVMVVIALKILILGIIISSFPLLLEVIFIGLFGLLAGMFFGRLMIGLLIGGEKNHAKVYDIEKRRYIRIKQDLIRQLRTVNMPKELKQEKVRDLHEIENTIKTLPDQGFVDKFLESVPWHRASTKNAEATRRMEENIDNNYHVLSAEWGGL